MSHRAIRLAAALLIVALVLWWSGRRISPQILPIVAAIHSLGVFGPVLFILLFVVAMVAFIPGSWLTIAGGAVFGLGPTVVYALIGGTLGSTAAFLVGRHVARRVVARHLTSIPHFDAIDRAVATQGRRIVFLLRLSPFSPFSFLNYALGLTAITARDFILASVGMIPSTFMYAYAGNVAGEALALAGQAEVARSASYSAILTAGLAATVAATTIVTRAARRALSDV